MQGCCRSDLPCCKVQQLRCLFIEHLDQIFGSAYREEMYHHQWSVRYGRLCCNLSTSQTWLMSVMTPSFDEFVACFKCFTESLYSIQRKKKKIWVCKHYSSQIYTIQESFAALRPFLTKGILGSVCFRSNVCGSLPLGFSACSCATTPACGENSLLQSWERLSCMAVWWHHRLPCMPAWDPSINRGFFQRSLIGPLYSKI